MLESYEDCLRAIAFYGYIVLMTIKEPRLDDDGGPIHKSFKPSICVTLLQLLISFPSDITVKSDHNLRSSIFSWSALKISWHSIAYFAHFLNEPFTVLKALSQSASLKLIFLSFTKIFQVDLKNNFHFVKTKKSTCIITLNNKNYIKVYVPCVWTMNSIGQ